jgi:hypothetical protein
VLDYTVSFAESGSPTYTVYREHILAKNIIVTGLTSGVEYSFVVQARNIVSLSEYSIEASQSAVQVPDAPTNLANVAAETTAT